MPIETVNVIEDAMAASLRNAGVPSAGTDEVQTLTIGGTPTGGSFKLGFQGFASAAIAWSSTNATLLSNINTALQALASIGASGVVATAGTLTAGIGTILLTFGGNLAKLVVPNITVVSNDLTGTAPTVVNAETTPGVNATGRGSQRGRTLIDTTNGKEYINTSANPLAPTWVVVGTQT